MSDISNLNNIFNHILGGSVMCLCIVILTEGSFQRFSSLPDVKSAQIAAVFNMVALYINLFTSCAIGLIATYFYKENNFKLPGNEKIAISVYSKLNNPPKYLSSIFIAILILAAISTLSTYLIAIENVFSECIFKILKQDPLTLNRKNTKSRASRFYRILMNKKSIQFIIGLVSTILSIFMCKYQGNLLSLALKILSFGYAPITAVVLMAYIDKSSKISSFSVNLSFLASSSVCFYMFITKVVYKEDYIFGFLYIPPFLWVHIEVFILFGLLVSISEIILKLNKALNDKLTF